MTPAQGAGANQWGQTASTTVTGLTPATTYTFRLKARNQGFPAIETTWVGPVDQATVGGVVCSLSGDLNADGLVTAADISGFVRARLGQPPQPGEVQECADYGTGTLEGDTALFVADLLN